MPYFLKIKKILTIPLILILILLQYLLNIENILTLNISIFFSFMFGEVKLILPSLNLKTLKKLINNLFEIITLTVLLMFNILTTNQGIEIATIVIFLTLLIKNYDVFLDKSAFKLISTLRKTMNENWIYISLNSLILNLTNFCIGILYCY